MSPNQVYTRVEPTYLVRPFQPQDWNALWQLRKYQLAEEGIVIGDGLPQKPDLSSPYEEDYHRIEHVYLTAKGNFWIAWKGVMPVGQIGAEDKGDYVELRRMYVRMEYRCRGMGTLLVQSLINHCITQKAGSIELWTAEHGLGRILYEKFGFQKAERAGKALDSSDQIRMRLALTD